jgi:Uma2 family endonuclease
MATVECLPVRLPKVRVPREQRFRISGVSWPDYLALSDALGERYVRVTYDRGEMELMTVSPEHERGKHLLGRLVNALTEELDIDIAGYGSMTCRREDIERAFEPDECYWVAHEAAVRGRDRIDFARDPAPDLAIEVEVSRSTMDRLSLYAALGVPELWLWDGERIRVVLLGGSGEYQESDHSLSFPFLPVTELVRFLTMHEESETRIIRAFRRWVRDQQAAGWGAKKARRNGGKGPAKGRRKPK